MDAGLVATILNVVFVVFVVLGFLFGLKGLKKSGLSLIYFIGALIIALIISPLICKLLLQINVTNSGGESVTVSQYIIDTIRNVPQIVEMWDTSPNLQSLVGNAPLIVGNLVVFMLLVYVVGFITWIAYLITARKLYKKPAKKQKNPLNKNVPGNVTATGTVKYVKDEVPVKKRRLLGGLVGSVHGLILLIATLIPVSGLVGLMTDIAFETESTGTGNPAQIYLLSGGEGGSGEEEQQLTPIARMIQENLPEDILDLIVSYDNSIIGTVSRFSGASSICFDALARCRVGNERVVLRNEIKIVAHVYNDVEFLKDVNFSDLEEIKEVDFDKLRSAVDNMFSSGVLRALAPELFSFGLEMASTDVEEISSNENIKDFVLKLQSMMQNDTAIMNTLKAEIINTIDLIEIVLKSDLADEFFVEGHTPDIENVVAILNEDDNLLLHQIVEKIFDSEIINLASLMGINFGLEPLRELLEMIVPVSYTVDIPRIDVKTTTLRLDGELIGDILGLGLDVYVELLDIGLENIENDFSILLEHDFDFIISGIGEIIDDVKNMAVLHDVYNGIFGALAVSEYNEYVNFSVALLNSFSWQEEFENLNVSVEKLLTLTVESEGESVNLIQHIVNTEDFSVIFSAISGENLSIILTPLLESELLRPLAVMCLNYVNTSVQEILGDTPAGEILGDIDLSEQSEEIITIVQDILVIIEDVMDDEDFDIADYVTDTENQENIVNILNNLQTNAQNDGVFTDLYDSMMDYITNDETMGADVTALLDTYTDETGTVDWAALIAAYVGGLEP